MDVSVRTACGEIVRYEVNIRDSAPCCSIDVSASGSKTQCFGGSDLFEAMIAWRRILDAVGSKLLCAGARTDVFPSGMLRDMSGGRKAYILRMGAQGRSEDIVDIFSATEPELVGTVGEQREYALRWRGSWLPGGRDKPRT
jgi:hypothetical protein